MKILLTLITVLCNILLSSAIAMEKTKIDDFRPVNVLQEREFWSYPEFNSEQDKVQFCQSLVKSEITFWEESGEILKTIYPRLDTVLKVVDSNHLDLETRMRMFSKIPEDLSWYQLYKSYLTIKSDLNTISEILGEKEGKGNPIGKIVNKLNENNEGMKEKNIRFGAYFRSTEMPLNAPYAFCGVEYVTDAFQPILIDILTGAKNKTELKSQKEIKTHKPKKKKKKAKKKKSRTPVKETSLLPQLLEIVPSGKENLPLHLEEEKSQVESEINHKIETEKQPSLPINNPTSPKEETRLLIKEDSEIRPSKWKNKKQNTAQKIKNENNNNTPKTLSLPSFVLGEEASSTARNLLAWAKVPGNVATNDYIKLIQELKGAVSNKKKSLHFSARSLSTGQWHSVSMHRLHGDDAHLIPHNTRYWKIARQLLIDIGLTESHLTPE